MQPAENCAHRSAQVEGPVRNAQHESVHIDSCSFIEYCGRMTVAIYLGKPCIHGHDGRRYVSNRVCVQCAAKSNSGNPDARRLAQIRRNTPGKHRHPITGIPYGDHEQRRLAREADRPFYHGRACKYDGHGTLRYTDRGKCVACKTAENQRAYAPRRKRQVEPTAYELEMLRWAAILV